MLLTTYFLHTLNLDFMCQFIDARDNIIILDESELIFR